MESLPLRLTANTKPSIQIVPKKQSEGVVETTVMEEHHIDDRYHLSNNKSMVSSVVNTSTDKGDSLTTPRNSILVLVIIFIVSLATMTYIYMMFPDLSV